MITPDFPRSAQLLAARWARDMGQTVDGVIAADPVGARYVLEATGAVTEPGGSTITAADVLQVLLRDAYRDIADAGDRATRSTRAWRSTIFRAVGAGQGDQQGRGHRAGPRGQPRGGSGCGRRTRRSRRRWPRRRIGAAFLTGDVPRRRRACSSTTGPRASSATT